jgi:hypothetical protein
MLSERVLIVLRPGIYQRPHLFFRHLNIPSTSRAIVGNNNWQYIVAASTQKKRHGRWPRSLEDGSCPAQV